MQSLRRETVCCHGSTFLRSLFSDGMRPVDCIETCVLPTSTTSLCPQSPDFGGSPNVSELGSGNA